MERLYPVQDVGAKDAETTSSLVGSYFLLNIVDWALHFPHFLSNSTLLLSFITLYYLIRKSKYALTLSYAMWYHESWTRRHLSSKTSLVWYSSMHHSPQPDIACWPQQALSLLNVPFCTIRHCLLSTRLVWPTNNVIATLASVSTHTSLACHAIWLTSYTPAYRAYHQQNLVAARGQLLTSQIFLEGVTFHQQPLLDALLRI